MASNETEVGKNGEKKQKFSTNKLLLYLETMEDRDVVIKK